MERPQPAVAAAEEALALYDTYWFHRLVLHSYSPAPAPLPPTPAPPALEQQPQPEQAPAESNRELQRAPTGLRHRRTRSDEAKTATFDAPLEPLKIPQTHRARLETILSGKDGLAAPQAPQAPTERRRRPGGRRRKQQARGRSLSELEFEEVKGLRDLGFTFSEADVDAELASIVPGLRRLRAAEEKEAKKAEAAAAAACAEEEACRGRAASASASRRRPYLSEAWEDEEAEVRRVLSTFRIPAADGGADLKEHLRLWAHNVASAVR
ncbi:translation initiation factor IF-2-like [Lolium rigidum]|uniref:translation initiation factor IF-2-like n=1 Tax=Lolium rigidum TaxID=89674 RepID=UPI001F5E173D|nr:translation initiation factor IF-2-like [Lolium rigidum]